jgi:hypothetical protein
MKLHGGRTSLVFALPAALLLLGACGKGAAPQDAPPTSSGGAPAASGVPAQPATAGLPSSAAGPSDGSTSIGGVVTHQGGTANSGQTPAPTAGDGAASAASR